MAMRPHYIDLTVDSSDPAFLSSSGFPSPRSLPSPRTPHVEGDIPPELSPLDAFAAQGRLLAKQIDDSHRQGRRISRLPPLAVASSLAQVRPTFLRAAISEDESISRPGTATSHPRDTSGPGEKAALATPDKRPVSVHPRMSGIPLDDADAPRLPTLLTQLREPPRRPSETRDSPRDPYRDPPRRPSVPRDQSSEPPRRPSESERTSNFYTNDNTPSSQALSESPRSIKSFREQAFPARQEHTYLPVRQQKSFDAVSANASTGSLPRTGLSPDQQSVRGQYPYALAPPSPVNRNRSSIRSVPMDSSDDDLAGSHHGAFAPLPRTISSGSVHAPTPPRSPFYPHARRSPSISSEYSLGDVLVPPRGTLNFSRPMSRASRPSMDTIPRQNSSDSQPSKTTDDTAHTPSSVDSRESMDTDPTKPVPSYIYSSFSLPRGRAVNRNSQIILDGRQFQSNPGDIQPPTLRVGNSNSASPVRQSPNREGRPALPPSPPRDPTSIHEKSQQTTSDQFFQARSLVPQPQLSPRPSAEDGSRSLDRERRPSHHEERPSRPFAHASHKSSHSFDTTSTSTLKARPATGVSSAEISAEEHLEKGIACHEAGSTNESTYHLRIAAKANNPTAMLLYALACRHGWGMRPNPREGVQWLRKAADFAGLEVADDDNLSKGGNPADIVERRARQAQFALSIYELGVSHMNGWGIEQDKALALRCFEIAGAWGDGDALAEAGFCYAQGVGCKKDLMKAARFYRMAESKGMSMVGNSWIYKSKYNPPGGDAEDRKARPMKRIDTDKSITAATREKSRTRTIFGRKKSITPA